jgi:Holliday junction resolvase RusA-like endonuclease
MRTRFGVLSLPYRPVNPYYPISKGYNQRFTASGTRLFRQMAAKLTKNARESTQLNSLLSQTLKWLLMVGAYSLF